MPLYEYACLCGCIAEIITGKCEIPDCPECGRKLERNHSDSLFFADKHRKTFARSPVKKRGGKNKGRGAYKK